MGDLVYIQSAIQVLNAREKLNKFEVQGNIIPKILSYWGYNIATCLSSGEITNDKYIDSLISFGFIKIPIALTEYSKSKCTENRFKNWNLSMPYSVLKQYMVANNLNFGIITDGDSYHFYQMGDKKDVKEIKVVYLDNLIQSQYVICNGKNDEKLFFDMFSSDKIEKTMKSLTNAKSLECFVNREYNTLFSIIKKEVDKSFVFDYSMKDLKDCLYRAYLQELKDNLIDEEYSESTIKDIKKVIRKNISNDIKLKEIPVNPKIFYLFDEKPTVFQTWTDVYISALNYLISHDEGKYNSWIDLNESSNTFKVIRKDTSLYNSYKNSSKYRTLCNGDLAQTSANRLVLCKHVLNMLKYYDSETYSLTFIYSSDCEIKLNNKGKRKSGVL